MTAKSRIALISGRLISGLLAVAVAGASAVFVAPAAQAAPVDGATAPGRASGSGKWGYVGQFGQLNKTSSATPGQFFLPYGIDINGSTIAVTDSGLSFEESGSKSLGHTVQTFTLDNAAGSAGHGDYLGNGQYDVRTDKSNIADPADIVTPIGLKYYPEGQIRGPRGVVVADDGTVVNSLHDDVAAGPGGPHLIRYGDTSFSAVTNSWGTSQWANNPGRVINTIQLASDGAGNTFSAAESSGAVNVFAPDGTFLSSVGFYFDDLGQSWADKVKWPTHKDDVPATYNDPHQIVTPHGVSLLDNGDGTLTVYVADGWGYYAPDPSVHFPAGATTAQYLKPATIKKYTVATSGGIVNEDFNPAGWKWTLDTSFGSGGQVVVGKGSLMKFLGKYINSPQIAFNVKADPGSSRVYYAMGTPGLNGAPVIGTLDGVTGDAVAGPQQVNAPGAQNDSKLSYVRGLSVDNRGLVYATSQSSTTTSTNRAIVQIFGMTPSPVPSASATPAQTSVTISWDPSVVGYAQPDLLDYVVKYRAVGATTWTTAAAATTTSTETTRELTGLTAETDYEACITPWNEAGSGDQACTTFTTKGVPSTLTVVKTGNGVSTDSASRAALIDADSNVAFEYKITNNGPSEVTGVELRDSVLGDIDAPEGFDGTLAAGDSVTFSSTGPVAAGGYVNTATATGVSQGVPISGKDVWYGFGVTRGLTVLKTGNGVTAETADNAVNVPEGSNVVFNYTVTNEGNMPVTGVELRDSVLGDIDAPEGFDGTLAAGDSVTFTATGPVAAGAYQNTAIAAGTSANKSVSAETAWNGFGVTSDLSVVKTGNDVANDSADAPLYLSAGSSVKFNYTIHNGGNTPIQIGTVTDSVLGPLTAPEGFNGTLAAGGDITYQASGEVPEGAYTNTVTVQATGQDDAKLSASDDWFGFGVTTGLKVVKTGNGEERPDADDPLVVSAGDEVAFAYAIVNTSNVPVKISSVVDTKTGPAIAPDGFDGVLEANGGHVTYTSHGKIPAGKYQNTVNVAGIAAGGTTLDATDDWHGFGLTVVTPQNPTVAQAACSATGELTGPTVTLTDTAGIRYSITGDIKAGSTVTVTAVADEGYKLAATNGWVASDGAMTFEVALKDISCSVTNPKNPTDSEELAHTGASFVVSAGILGALMLVAGGAMVITRRRSETRR